MPVMRNVPLRRIWIHLLISASHVILSAETVLEDRQIIALIALSGSSWIPGIRLATIPVAMDTIKTKIF